MFASPVAAPTRPRRERLASLKDPFPAGSSSSFRQPTPPARRQNAPRKESCGCGNPDIREVNGQRVCLECGEVVVETQIVSEITFGETAAGAATVQGGFVGENQRFTNTMGGGMHGMGGMDSREQTEMRGRMEIRALVAALNLPEYLQDQSMAIYRLAINHSFIQGRRCRNVAAACIYISARRRRDNTLLLMDLAEKLQVNVWTLGDVYKELLKTLMMEDPVNTGIVDIEPLMLKYCLRLEFEKDAHRVANDAVMILRRMKRDWMVQGRQPAGICGACILLAARMNNFRRTIREVVYVVKVADATVASRLSEFNRTESSRLSVEQFKKFGNRLKVKTVPPAIYKREEREAKRKRAEIDRQTIDVDAPEGSPVPEVAESGTTKVTKKRKVAKGKAQPVAAEASSSNVTPQPTKRKRTELDGQTDDVGSPGSSPVPEAATADAEPTKVTKKRKTSKGKAQAVQATPPPSQVPSTGGSSVQDASMPPRRDADGFAIPRKPSPKVTIQPTSSQLEEESVIAQALFDANGIDHVQHLARAEGGLVVDPEEDEEEEQAGKSRKRGRGRPKKQPKRQPIQVSEEDLEIENELEDEINQVITDYQSMLEDPNHPIFRETQAAAAKILAQMLPNGQMQFEENVEEDEFAGDPEVQNCLLRPEEVAVKERIWCTSNEDWLRAAQKKMLEKALLEASGGPRKKKTRRKHSQMGDGSVLEGVPAASAAESASRMLRKRTPNLPTFSNFLDYDRLNAIFTPPAGLSRDSEDGDANETGDSSGATPNGPTPPGQVDEGGWKQVAVGDDEDEEEEEEDYDETAHYEEEVVEDYYEDEEENLGFDHDEDDY